MGNDPNIHDRLREALKPTRTGSFGKTNKNVIQECASSLDFLDLFMPKVPKDLQAVVIETWKNKATSIVPAAESMLKGKRLQALQALKAKRDVANQANTNKYVPTTSAVQGKDDNKMENEEELEDGEEAKVEKKRKVEHTMQTTLDSKKKMKKEQKVEQSD